MNRRTALLVLVPVIGVAAALGALAGGGAARGEAEAARGVDLSWFGQSFFLLRSPGGTRVAIDPINPVDPFLAAKTNIRKLEGSSVTLRKEDLPKTPQVYVLVAPGSQKK